MGFYNIFVALLIFAGVLSSGRAQDYWQGQYDAMCRMLAESGKVPFDMNCNMEMQQPRVDPVEKFLKEKCEKNGSPSSYKDAQDGVELFGTCVRIMLDTRNIEFDLAAARPKNQLRGVYKKYCLRAPIIRECVKYATDGIGSCLSAPEERKSAEMIYNVANRFLEFICHDDGEQLALFEEPGSMECVVSMNDAMLSCANETFGSYIPADRDGRGTGASDLGRLATPLIPSDEDCQNLDRFQSCIVGSLAECDNKGPASLINSAFNSIKLETPCRNLFEIDGLAPIGNLLSGNETEIFNSTVALEYPISRDQNFLSLLREKCAKNGGPRAFKTAKKAPQYLEDCFNSLVNTTQLGAEIEGAAPTGELNVVFAKYCRKVPNLKKCVRHATKLIKPCLDPEVRTNIDVINNVTRALMRFTCHGDGDRLASFITSAAPQCLESKKEALKNCATQIYNKYDTAATGSGEFGRFEASLVLATEDCANVREFQRCTFRALAECDDSTAANMTKSLIDSLIRATPCRHKEKKKY